MKQERALILWDGECGMCRRATAWVRHKDTRHLFDILPYQQCPSPPMTPEYFQACAEAVHVYTPEGRMLRAGYACLYILERVGWGVVARTLTFIPFIWFAEIGYRIVARNRPFFASFMFTREFPNPKDES